MQDSWTKVYKEVQWFHFFIRHCPSSGLSLDIQQKNASDFPAIRV